MTKFGFVYVFSSNCLYIIREGERIVLLVLIYVNNMAVADLEGSKIISFKIHIFIWLSSASTRKYILYIDFKRVIGNLIT